MAGNPLSRGFTILAARLSRELPEILNNIADEVQQRVIHDTPLDTGRAKANWIITLGTGARSFNWNAYDKSGVATIAANSAVIRARQPEEPVFLTNNLAYVPGLNRNRSAQAPSFYVQSAVLDGVRAGLASR